MNIDFITVVSYICFGIVVLMCVIALIGIVNICAAIIQMIVEKIKNKRM